MDKNQLRLALAGVAAFYVIVGGLFIQAYIPVARFDRVIAESARSGDAFDYDIEGGVKLLRSLDPDVSTRPQRPPAPMGHLNI